MTIDDIRTSRPQDPDHRHTALPHSHGHAHLHVASVAVLDPAQFTPHFSLLRTSILVRLGISLLASILIWAALYGAMQ
jgi:hypothetical protein